MAVRGRLIKTSIAREYDRAIESWAIENRAFVERLRTEFNRLWVSGTKMFHIELYFCFEKSRLISKANTVKRLDCNNRIKSAIDKVSLITGIDDQYFISDYAEKIISESDELIVRITPTTLRSRREILTQLKSEND